MYEKFLKKILAMIKTTNGHCDDSPKPGGAGHCS